MNTTTIINYLDKYLQTTGRKSISPVEANAILEKAGLLKDSKSRPGLPLRKMLRNGELPHAYQVSGKWIIPLSKNIKTTCSSDSNHPIKEGRDEDYVIDLCDEALGAKASRQHCFDFLVGDTGRQLPVDAYYKGRQLVVEYYEKQHTESVEFFDNKKTVSGVSRGEQRKIYDERRKTILPQKGITLVVISYDDFQHNRKKRIIRNREQDLEIIKQKLSKFINTSHKITES